MRELIFHKLSPTSYFECDVFCNYLFQIFCPDSMHDQFLKHGEHPCRVQVDRKVGYINIHCGCFLSYLWSTLSQVMWSVRWSSPWSFPVKNPVHGKIAIPTICDAFVSMSCTLLSHIVGILWNTSPWYLLHNARDVRAASFRMHWLRAVPPYRKYHPCFWK